MTNILNVINLLVQCGILLIAFKALEQIRISKKSINISSEIASAQYTGQLIKDFYKETEPAINELGDFYRKIGYKAFEGKLDLEFFTLEELKKTKYLSHFDNSVKKVLGTPEGTRKVSRVTNGLDIFAVSCAKGIANDEIAFSAIGRLFCENVRELYYVYCLLRQEQKGSEECFFYKNTIDLYKIWSSRIERYNLLSTQKELEKNLSIFKDSKIQTIGKIKS